MEDQRLSVGVRRTRYGAQLKVKDMMPKHRLPSAVPMPNCGKDTAEGTLGSSTDSSLREDRVGHAQ